MKELIDKLSTYNIFNYLFPGITFVILLKECTSYNFIQDDIIIGVFLYYLIGLVISRFGSLLIEPLLKKFRFLKFTEYKNFIKASKKDPKVDLFSEINNMYRTICSLFLLLLIFKLYDFIEKEIPFIKTWSIELLIILLLCLFLFSYRKQTRYIKERVEVNNE
ncbi:MAG: hypothetical protein WC223_10830 [Bacteroidales bacterium]|jgi:hypothetical protein